MRLTQMFFSAKGRIRRRDYWLYGVLNFAFFFVFAAVLYGTLAVLGLAKPADGHGGGQWAYLWLPVYLWASVCMTIKRWHDRGKSGWWTLISLIPGIGFVWTLIECGILDGTPGDNAYGPSPKA